jgi:hypothetical protein
VQIPTLTNPQHSIQHSRGIPHCRLRPVGRWDFALFSRIRAALQPPTHRARGPQGVGRRRKVKGFINEPAVQFGDWKYPRHPPLSLSYHVCLLPLSTRQCLNLWDHKRTVYTTTTVTPTKPFPLIPNPHRGPGPRPHKPLPPPQGPPNPETIFTTTTIIKSTVSVLQPGSGESCTTAGTTGLCTNASTGGGAFPTSSGILNPNTPSSPNDSYVVHHTPPFLRSIIATDPNHRLLCLRFARNRRAILGLTLGGVLALAFVALWLYFASRRRRLRRQEHAAAMSMQAPNQTTGDANGRYRSIVHAPLEDEDVDDVLNAQLAREGSRDAMLERQGSEPVAALAALSQHRPRQLSAEFDRDDSWRRRLSVRHTTGRDDQGSFLDTSDAGRYAGNPLIPPPSNGNSNSSSTSSMSYGPPQQPTAGTRVHASSSSLSSSTPLRPRFTVIPPITPAPVPGRRTRFGLWGQNRDGREARAEGDSQGNGGHTHHRMPSDPLALPGPSSLLRPAPPLPPLPLAPTTLSPSALLSPPGTERSSRDDIDSTSDMNLDTEGLLDPGMVLRPMGGGPGLGGETPGGQQSLTSLKDHLDYTRRLFSGVRSPLFASAETMR